MSPNCRAHENPEKTLSWKEVVSRLQEKLANACTQGKHDLTALQIREDVERDTLHAVVPDCTCVQMLLDDERHMHRSVELVVADLRRDVGPQSA